jgi:hypothetical protein
MRFYKHLLGDVSYTIPSVLELDHFKEPPGPGTSFGRALCAMHIPRCRGK